MVDQLEKLITVLKEKQSKEVSQEEVISKINELLKLKVTKDNIDYCNPIISNKPFRGSKQLEILKRALELYRDQLIPAMINKELLKLDSIIPKLKDLNKTSE